MAGFNFLELAVLQWFKDHYNETKLPLQIDAAQFTKREWTKVGFYVYFSVPENLPCVDFHWPVNGPTLKSDEIEHDGGSILWGENGYMNCIEMYAFGNFFGENIRKFTLINPGQV